MVFQFLKYIKPVWYFNLKSKKDFGYFPTFEQIKKNNCKLLPDPDYQSIEAQNRDLGYTALQSGFINTSSENGLDIFKITTIPVVDEYRFLRKNFNIAWVLYVLIIRIFTFNNPIKEISGFLKSNNAKRKNYSIHKIEHPDYELFESNLSKSTNCCYNSNFESISISKRCNARFRKSNV
jgi:hypothetical protein